MTDEVLVVHDDTTVIVTTNRHKQRSAVNRAVSYGVREALDGLDSTATTCGPECTCE